MGTIIDISTRRKCTQSSECRCSSCKNLGGMFFTEPAINCIEEKKIWAVVIVNNVHWLAILDRALPGYEAVTDGVLFTMIHPDTAKHLIDHKLAIDLTAGVQQQ